MLSKTHYVFFVPGLGGETSLFRLAVHSWKRFGFIPIVHDVGWKDGEEKFGPKLEKLLSRIDTIHATGGIISLIGTSAGGSAVLNAFTQRTEKIHRIVNICGRLRAGNSVYPTLENASLKSNSFKESVMMFETNEPNLTNDERKKIMTIRSLFDETVPTTTISVRGAQNIQIVSVEHNLSIALEMIVYAGKLVEFLRKS